MSSLITAMVTIFKEDLSVDYDACLNLADFLVENGSDGLVVSGTTGESPTLTVQEKLNLFSQIKDHVGDKAQVIAGTGSNCTDSTIKLSKEAQAADVDGLMLVTPYYNKPPQQGLIDHFQKVADAVDLPIILYNVPSRTGSNMEADTTIVLSKIENIVAVKEASGNLEQIKKIVDNTDTDFKVYSGDDAATFAIMKLGGHGVISVASHIIGNQIKQLIKLCDEENFPDAAKMNDQLMPVFEGLFKTTNPILVKAGLELIGQVGGPLRLPLIEATDQQKNDLKSLLISSGLIEKSILV